MTATEISIRPARQEDAEFIARNVMRGMGIDEPHPVLLKALTEVCGMDDTLYSYRNTRIATIEDIPVGSLTAYDGGIYEQTSKRTFSRVAQMTGQVIGNPGKETKAGEFYLDSLAVIPEYRGHSIGSALMRDGLQVAKQQGFSLVSLIVDKKKPDLHALYSRLGFRPDGELLFFGEEYLRMVQII